MKKDSKIYIAGHNGMVGSAILRDLEKNGFTNIVKRTRKELDLLDQKEVLNFFEKEKPEYVFMAAAKVGGIIANRENPASFIYENLMVETNIINSAHKTNVKKLLFLGSSCIYPKFATQPMTEDCLLSGELESTNEFYAIAKIAGIKLCQAYRKQYGCDFISVMPTNLYGEHDSYNLQNSHVIPAMIRKFHEAKSLNKPNVTIWGTGTPKREFLYADDLANACVFLMQNYSEYEHVNIGTGIDVTIKELAETVKKVTGYNGEIIFDITKPDGTPRKLLDVSKLNKLGWEYSINLEKGLNITYAAFQKEINDGTLRD
jgi:GDP-L-fucose synthase